MATATEQLEQAAADRQPRTPLAADAASAKPERIALPAVAPATHLTYLIQNTTPCVLRPFCFFVSWQGVITLAYKGFPAELVALKSDLSDYYGGLPKENPGSLWPKTSLAAVKDNKRLTPEQLRTLISICWEFSGVFQAPGSPKAQAVLVDRLAAVIYECRSLERQVSKHVMHMRGSSITHVNGASGGGSSDGGGGSGGGALTVDCSEPPAEERARVAAVIKEAESPDYWVQASRDGNRESHYRTPAVGATLVHELACFNPVQEGATMDAAYSTALPDIVRRFRARVDAALPDMYAWWEEKSLHVTIRALIP